MNIILIGYRATGKTTLARLLAEKLGWQWIDADVQKAGAAKRVRVQFGSKEYFDLAVRHPETTRWLALGQNVQFVLNRTLYEIFE